MTHLEAEPRIRLDLAERSYEIHVAAGLLARAGALIRPHVGSNRLFVIADATVAELHGAALAASLAAAGLEFSVILIPPGEGSKSFAQLESLLDILLDAAPERSTALLAFGGGVVGDLTGFAASVLLRGVPFLQMPTTLLSQVDSSVGGKTGINMRQGKNLVGSFYQPRLVLADIDLLDSLPRRELLSGYGEVVKYGLIDDADFFAWLESNGAALLRGDRELRRQAVDHCCRAKARIVGADEREQANRALLNLGHTFGHALEAETGFSSTLLHGEAVALGCLMAFGLSVRLDLCPAEDFLRLCRHLHQIGLPTALPPGPDWDAQRLFAHFAHDKKVSQGRLTFILARGIGKSFVSRDVPTEILLEVLEDWIEDSREIGSS